MCKRCAITEYCNIKAESTNVFIRTDTEYTVLPQRLRTGGKSGTAANHWEK